MKLQGWNVVGVMVCAASLGALGATTEGCSTTASGAVSVGVGTSEPVITDFPAGCATDSALSCTGNSLGITCPSGTSPDSSAYYCSEPTATASGDSYCCLTWSGGSDCTNDPNVTCPDPNSWGFSCQNGYTPDNGDNTLVCSEPGGTGQQYCCTDGTTVVVVGGSSGGSSSGGSTSGGSTSGGSSSGTSATCAADSSLQCDAGSTGYSCPTGATIASDDPTFICSDPTTMADGTDGYCCITAYPSTGTCTQDDSVTGGCAYPSIGFSCTGSDSPMDADPSLTCSVPGGNGMQFCCQ